MRTNQIKIEAPENASKREIRVHGFLNDLKIHKINIGSYIEELDAEKTPKIQ